jgi:hypothetical protein
MEGMLRSTRKPPRQVECCAVVGPEPQGETAYSPSRVLICADRKSKRVNDGGRSLTNLCKPKGASNVSFSSSDDRIFSLRHIHPQFGICLAVTTTNAAAKSIRAAQTAPKPVSRRTDRRVSELATSARSPLMFAAANANRSHRATIRPRWIIREPR